jgi:hypothetical protein
LADPAFEYLAAKAADERQMWLQVGCNSTNTAYDDVLDSADW